VEIAGLVDTGSFHTVIDERSVEKNDWKIDRPGPVLGAAGNNPLYCVGTCELVTELTINRRTRSAKLHFAVVAKLGVGLLIGFEFLFIFRVLIYAEARQLSFRRNSIVRSAREEIRTKEGLSQEPRSQSLIEALSPVTGTILPIPTVLECGIMVANSVSGARDNTTRLMVLNPTERTVALLRDNLVASYELIDDANVGDIINQVAVLEGVDECVLK